MMRAAEPTSAAPLAEAAELDITSALASTRSGALLDPRTENEQLHNLAATLPEIFGTLDPGCLQRVAERIGAASASHDLSEVLLLSESGLHVMQPISTRPHVALLAVSPATNSIGLVLSRVRIRAAELEGEK